MHRSSSVSADPSHVAAQPALIVVAGRPGAGKTTLAHALARALHCPAICRDEIREGLMQTMGAANADDDAIARRANDAFFATLTLLLGHGVTVVAEAAFQHKVWKPRLEALLPVSRVRIVLCEIDAELARARWVARGTDDPGRAHLHGETGGADKLRVTHDPPDIGVPTLRVDTSDGYDPSFDAIVEFCRG